MIKTDMPYDRYKQFGPKQLTDYDLLEIIIRSGTGNCSVFEIVHSLLSLELIKENGLAGLFYITEKDLCQIKGIGNIKASQLICMFELAKRMYISKSNEKISFDNARSIADYYMYSFKGLEQEQIVIVYLDTKLKKISDETIFLGTVNSSIISPREILIKALKNNAVYFVLLHNHPSGDSTPSQEDRNVTLRIKSCSELIQIPLLDHIIIGDKNYYSMKEHGLI